MSKSVLQLLNDLESQHDGDRHLYRGQTRRHEPHQWTVGQETREVEGLYPGDFRFHYKHRDFSPEHASQIMRDVTGARAHGRMERDQFVLFLIVLFARLGEQAAWAQALFPELVEAVKRLGPPPLDTRLFRVAWSLAQHYGLTTALTDLTFDPRVAAWFATQPWVAEAASPRAGERGVIYRIDRSRMEPILNRWTEFMRKSATEDGLPTPPALFLVDIRDIPADFARRPSAQQGASLYGFDQAIVIAAAFMGGAIEAFEFDHHPGLDIGIRRTDLIPSDDPFLSDVARFIAFRDVIRPHATGSEPRAGTSADLLERANDALGLAVISAHECERIPVKNHIVATVFDAIQRRGFIRFRYLMIVEDEDVKAILCAVTAEPMELEEPLRSRLPAALHELRLWVPETAMAAGVGQWSSVREFADRALEVARSAISA